MNVLGFTVSAGKEKLERWSYVILQVASMGGSIFHALIYRLPPLTLGFVRTVEYLKLELFMVVFMI